MQRYALLILTTIRNRGDAYHQDEKEMLTLWLADKFIDAVEGEQERDLCNDAIIIAQEIIRAM